MEQIITKKADVSRVASVRLITYGSFLAFFFFGFVDNIKGPTLPNLLQELNFTYAQGGTILFGAYLGFLIATIFTGPLSDIIGKKMIILIACSCYFLGITGFSSFSTLWILTGAMTILGLGMGSTEVGANLIIVDLYQQEKGRYLNLLAFFHGVGSMVAPLYAGWLIAGNISWRRVYQFGLLLVFFLFLYFLFLHYPKSSSSESHKLDIKTLGKSALTREMMLYCFLIAMYVAAEIGIGSWLVEFLQKVKLQSVTTSSLFLSLFFGTITVGRFVGSFFIERIGYLKMMLYASIASVVCVVLGIFGPEILSVCLPITGLFFSIMFPTVTAAVSELHEENIGTILGLLFAFAGGGGILGPWLIGLLSDRVGIYLGFGMVFIFCIAMCVTLLLLMVRKSES